MSAPREETEVPEANCRECVYWTRQDGRTGRCGQLNATVDEEFACTLHKESDKL